MRSFTRFLLSSSFVHFGKKTIVVFNIIFLNFDIKKHQLYAFNPKADLYTECRLVEQFVPLILRQFSCPGAAHYSTRHLAICSGHFRTATDCTCGLSRFFTVTLAYLSSPFIRQSTWELPVHALFGQNKTA